MNNFLKRSILFSLLFFLFTSSSVVQPQNDIATSKLKESLGLLLFSIACTSFGVLCIRNDVQNSFPDRGGASALALGLTALVPTTLTFIKAWSAFHKKPTPEN